MRRVQLDAVEPGSATLPPSDERVEPPPTSSSVNGREATGSRGERVTDGRQARTRWARPASRAEVHELPPNAPPPLIACARARRSGIASSPVRLEDVPGAVPRLGATTVPPTIAIATPPRATPLQLRVAGEREAVPDQPRSVRGRDDAIPSDSRPCSSGSESANVPGSQAGTTRVRV